MAVRGEARLELPMPCIGLVALAVAAFAALAGLVPSAEAATKTNATRYSLVKGCFALRPAAGGDYVAQTGDGYSASAGGKSAAEPFRMQATALGKYLFYGPARDFMALDKLGGGVVVANRATPQADWTVKGRAGTFVITNDAEDAGLAVGPDGRLVSVPPGEAQPFGFVPTGGCARYPEVNLSVKGKAAKSAPAYGEVKGFLEGHMHQMAFDFLGGKAHCGRPWHPYGAPYALVDCDDHKLANGCAAILENILYGNPARCHDPVGWPTFKDWPHPNSLTHESSYYRWLERAHRGGLRVFVNLMVENRTLCEIYPFRRPGYNCNEMDSVLRQLKRMHELEDYIDAQSGGPGKGWYRLVRNPFAARKVISQGKLAVVMGMEVSEPFGCRLVPPNEPHPQCTTEHIDGWLDRLRKLGVRQLEIINKTDNALGGVAGDSGEFGVATSTANFMSSGSFWDMGECEDPENHDKEPTTAVLPHNDDLIIANGFRELMPVQPLPIYPEGPICNQYGLSGLGKHAVREIMDQGMIFDPDHLSVLARNKSMDLLERREYPGAFSSHSWSTPNATPRIFKLGGVITPSAGGSSSFVGKWEKLRAKRKRNDQYFGVGYGADANGFANQGTARSDAGQNPVEYPFESFDGAVTLKRNVSGVRTFDLNTDGVAHYGMYPDWIEDLRILAGDPIIRDMSRGAEAYLQMWERAFSGVPGRRCGGWKRKLRAAGIGSRLHLGTRARPTLKQAGQPHRRTRVWRWCGGGDREVSASFDRRARVQLILSDLRRHRAGGMKVAAERIAPGVFAGPTRRGATFVYLGTRKRVSHAGVADAALASRPAALARKLLRAAG